MPDRSDMTEAGPHDDHMTATSRPHLNLVNTGKTTERRKELSTSDRNIIIFSIIRDLPALTAMEIIQLLRQFCKSQGYFERSPVVDIDYDLKKLIKANKIVKIKILERMRYFVKY